MKTSPLAYWQIHYKTENLPDSGDGKGEKEVSLLRNTNRMANYENCCSTQLIEGDGTFNVAGIENFVKKVQLVRCGLLYVVVSIMGPQSSGKSTLVNCLFGTNFTEMNALEGRSQTTKGVWIAKCAGIEPCTLVLDLEGTDGRERGEEDTTFEKQSALFALTVSDVVLINMWCHDIGREHAANKPLLKTVFQVKMKLFTSRKITLLFVIRDKTRTPLDRLEKVLREDIEMIWKNVTKSKLGAHNETPLSEFFNVEVVALSSYEDKEDQFKEEVAGLRQRFCHSIAPGGLAGDRCEVVPASGFSYSSQQIWEKIKVNKDLDLPSHKAMVATIRCQQIAEETYDAFAAKKEWLQLEEDMKCVPAPGFVNKLNLLIVDCLSKYDAEAIDYDEGARSTYLNRLKEKMLQLIEPAFLSAMEHIRSRILVEFKDSFNEAFNGGEEFSAAANSCIESCMSHFDEACADVVIEQANKGKAEVREKLQCDIEAHVTFARVAKISELTLSYQEKLKEALYEPVEALLDRAKSNSWSSIRKLLRRKTKLAVSRLCATLTGFDMDENTRQEIILSLENSARVVVEEKARDQAGRVLIRMKDRFSKLFSHDSDSLPRVWTGKEDIQDIAETARSASLELLSVMAAIRLNNDDIDNIEETLKVALLGSSSSDANGRSISKSDLLASNIWDQVPPCAILITPHRCKELWDQFITETNHIISKANEQQEVIDKVHGFKDAVAIFFRVVSAGLTIAALATGVHQSSP